MTDLEKVELLQKEIKADNVKVADLMKYGKIDRRTLYNLRDDKVTPAKMTAKMVADLARIYTILFPDEPDDRSYKFGQLLAVLQAVAPVPERQYRWFVKKPMDTFKIIFEQQSTDNFARSQMFEGERMRVMDRFSIEEYDNRPLDGLYLLGQGQEGHRLRQMGLI